MGLAGQARRAWRDLWRKPLPPVPDCTLVLRRPRGGWLAWRVEKDGARLTGLRPGAERRVRLVAGRHTLVVWAGDAGSLPLVLSLAPGETAVVEAMTTRRAAHLGLVPDGFAPDPLLLRRIG